MDRLPMCRICLSENVRLCLVASRNLHELYEKLTDMPFVTEDSRPMMACVFCCAKLKQCYRLLRQCLKAEKLFAQRMNDKYEPNCLINEYGFRVFGGFIKSPVEQINIVGHIAVGEELSAVCDGPDDVIEPKEEYQSDELKPENLDNSCLNVVGIQPHCYELDLEADVSLIECKTEVEDEEVSKKNRRARETIKLEPENLDNSCLDVADVPHYYESDLEIEVPLVNCKTELDDEKVSKKISNTETIKLEPENSDNSCPDVAGIPPHCYESDLEDDIPLINFKAEVEEEEISNKKRRAREAIKATLVRNSKQDKRRTKEKDAITAEQTTKYASGPKVIQTPGKWTSKPGAYFKEPYTCNRRSSNIVKKDYLCDVCQRNFIDKTSLTVHMRTHTGEKPYGCNICQRNFGHKTNLTAHMRTHTGEKPHKCDLCTRYFIKKSNLTVHMRTHTGEKPYECDFCQRNFGQRSHLIQHMRTHTGEKPHKCNICQRNFGHKNYLIAHMRTHTGEKPYKCELCPHYCTRKSNLTVHMRTHTGEKPYECILCQRNYSHKNNLIAHMRTHIDEKPYKRHLSAQLQ